MTETEFNQGWRLLLLQPWAYRYRGVNEFGEPSQEAKGQKDFYFEHLKLCGAAEWLRIAEEYAKGKEWPSIDALRKSVSSVSARLYGQRDPEGGPLLSKEEFGQDLYEAIRLQSGQIQQEKNALLYEKQGLTKMAKQARESATLLRDQLITIFQRNTLSPDDLRRVLSIG
jgi:hypothetical protein